MVTTPLSKAQRRAPQRIEGEIHSLEHIQQAVKRAEFAKGRAQTAKREKRTPLHKQTHAVNNEDVHSLNETARQLDARHEIERDSELPTAWRPTTKLDAPPPRPGFKNRWVSLRKGGEEDADHFDDMVEQGWSPVKRTRVKKAHELTADAHGKYGPFYVKRGMILMEIPEKFAVQRDRYYKEIQNKMDRGVNENLFKLNRTHHSMQMLRPERSVRTSTSARRGRLEAAIPGDEGVDTETRIE